MNRDQPIAIVGIGGLFPGAPALASFWANIAQKIDTAADAPEGRWPMPRESVYDPEIGRIDRVYSTRGCFLCDSFLDPAQFENAGLDIDVDLLSQLDSLFTLTLEVGRQTFADAVTGNLDRRRVGTILANIVLPTETTSSITEEIFGPLLKAKGLSVDASSANGSSGGLRAHPLNRHPAGLPAALLAKALGLGGGGFTLDAACASSLYAVKLACDELRAGRADAMLTGGISRPDSLYTQMGFSQLRALSPSGRSAPFDARADGLVVGEGAGMFLLKRLPDALRDGDRIYGLIRGVGLSNDTGGSLLAPDSEGQMRALTEAYRRVGWTPGMIDLIECHATATPVGDAVEIRSLKRLWSDEPGPPGRCAIGSVKSNIGHLLTAAGAAGLMKVLLAFKERTLPPSANFERANENLDLADSPFRVQTEPEPWAPQNAGAPRRAAVNAFGFGGINAHLLVEEFQPERAEALLERKTSLPGAALDPKAAPIPAENATLPVPVAIVGMAVHFGSLDTLRKFQEAALTGRGDFRELPRDRWWGLDRISFPDAPSGVRGAYLEEFSVPFGRFRISPNELKEMLPQQLLMLHVVDRALADAEAPRADGARAGAFIGIGLDFNTSNYRLRWTLPQGNPDGAQEFDVAQASSPEEMRAAADAASDPLTPGRVTGGLGGMIASRIAREFHIGGPAFTLSAEENSGVRALEIGVRALQRRELDWTVAGAVDLTGDVRAMATRHALQPFSAREAPAPFDPQADGTLPGEGAVALILKRLDDAVRDGDRIYAAIDGMGASSGCEGDSLSASGDACAEALRRACAEAGVDPLDLGFLEMNASGEVETDAAEAGAVAECFKRALAERESPPEARTALGSVKSVIGDAGAASGLASVARAALCLYQEMLPGVDAPAAPLAALTELPDRFHLPRRPQYWMRNRADGPRRAGVQCLGVGGNCTHVVLEAPEDLPLAENARQKTAIERLQPLGASGEALFAVEADSAPELIDELKQLKQWAETQPKAKNETAETLARKWFSSRGQQPAKTRGAALVARDRTELLRLVDAAALHLETEPTRRFRDNPQLTDRAFYNPDPRAVAKAPVQGTPQPGEASARRRQGAQGEVAFVFPGSGNQYLGMGLEAEARWPELLRRLDGENQYLLRQFASDLYAPWRADWPTGWENESEERLWRDHPAMIAGHVSHGAFLSDVVAQFGVRPRAVIGYSLGESAGFFALRVWRERDEMIRRMRRSPLFKTELVEPYDAARRRWGLGENEKVEWTVGVVDRAEDDVRAALDGLQRAYLMIVNTPDECVIGGDRSAVEELVRRLSCRFIPLRGISTVHCEIGRDVQQLYRGLHLFKTHVPPDIRFYGGAWHRPLELNRQIAADTMVAQVKGTIHFPKTIERAYNEGARIFIEMGPRNSCSRMIAKILGDRPHLARSVCVQGQDDVSSVLRCLGALIAERTPVDLTPLYGLETRAAAHQAESEEERTRPKIRIRTGRSIPNFLPPLAAQPPSAGHTERPAPKPEPALARKREPKPTEERTPGSDNGHARRPAPAASPPPPRPQQPFARASTPHRSLREHPAQTLGAALTEMQRTRAEAHEIFLRANDAAARNQLQAISFQMGLIEALKRSGTGAHDSIATPPPPQAPVFLPREGCLEFARGRIADALGERFAPIDRHPTRVRLPDEPLMLVDRITRIEGEPCSLGPGALTTEHDVKPGAWYLDAERFVPGVCIEAGQADLFLSAWLGIDFQTRGESRYRLLDAAVAFHRGLPRPGDVIRYEIRIDRFIRQGDTWMFFFRFDAFIGDDPLMSMTDGCAGFFTPRQLAEGRGLVQSEEEQEPRAEVVAQASSPARFAPMKRECCDDAQLEALRNGNLPGGFGPDFENLSLRDPLTLPKQPLGLLHRIPDLDPLGGRFGLGCIEAETDIHPDDWFLTCHFVDDNVMPGTLMYESSLHALRIFMLRMGWIGERTEVAFEPVPGVRSRLKCRGQVVAQTRKAQYKVEIKEIGFRPEPYAVADAIMYADGRPIVQVADMSLRLTGTTREKLAAIWRKTETAPPLFGKDRLLASAVGKPSVAFGKAFARFDDGRFLARLPGPPYDFISRIVNVESRMGERKIGASVEGEYDVPPDAWYFCANRQPLMPFAVLLEFPLQVCGWFSTWLGIPLDSEKDLHFRNLGGSGVLHRPVGPDDGTLAARVRLTQLSSAGEMTILHFDLAVYGKQNQKTIYEGKTYFGFFTKESLARQAGLQGAAAYAPSEDEMKNAQPMHWPEAAPLHPDDPETTAGNGLALPSRALRMIDRIDVWLPNGGPHGEGFLRGVKHVDPGEWFFKAHFFQDPVWPGSLGLEGFIQLLKAFASERWGREIGDTHVFEPIATGVEHAWSYRGQVIPTNREVVIEAVIREVDDASKQIVADGFLRVDGLTIYEMKNFAIRAVPIPHRKVDLQP